MIAGLTGGIATGKSTVAARLRTLGATVVDADEVSREVVAPGTVALQSIREAFGEGILHADGRLNREALGNIVRVDSAARKQLESITHHHIRAEIAKRVQDAVIAGAPSVFVEAALLVETGSAAAYPELWVVRCSLENQIRRLMERNGCDRRTAEEWIATQMPVEQKAKHASVVLDNDTDLETLWRTTDAAYAHFMAQLPDQD